MTFPRCNGSREGGMVIVPSYQAAEEPCSANLICSK
jgi:hypothetical protein